jgi:uncharacterized repeat protein (TIGR01451 family)
MPKPPGTPNLDLTDADSFGVIDGVVFMMGMTQPAGTGVFDTFLRLQHNGSEQGYNTDAAPQYDEKNSHTSSLLLADIPIVFGDGTNGTVEGLAYRELLLDLNEAGGGKMYLSLDELQIWQQEAGDLTDFTPDAGFAGAHTNYLAYDLDAGGDKWIALSSQGDGSGQSDYRILIPDSYFINDAAHRYVTLYSQFGLQAGWNSDGGFEEWGLSEVGDGPTSAFSVTKTATVPGGTADTAGEVISYAITVSNTGDQNLTGLTVTDPSIADLAAVLSGAFNIGDTNMDGQLSIGETWQYSGSYTVTQSDIDTNADGRGAINNTATADTDQTSPVSASASVAVERRPIVDLVKTADVSSVDGAGDVITYMITVANTGNVTLSGPAVTDTQVNIVTPVYDFGAPILGPELLVPILNGDYNIGDTNENGIEDPGETFQFKNPGDDNNNGIEDPGETFFYTNVGDTNQNGGEDPGETFQYYNAGDTNQNGVEDDGETFQFSVDNSATPVDANFDGINDGDVNFDGQINLGETWQYTVTYTVTQDDIDNGGVVDPGLTHDNTATVTTDQSDPDSDTVSVSIVQNPHLTVTKAAAVADGTADEAGDLINYTIAVFNDGNMTLTGLAVSDPSVDDLAAVESGGFNTGDTDQDGKLDLGETWQYTASYTITQDDLDAGGSIDNTATASTDQGATDDDSQSITIVQNPLVTLVKDASVPGGTADSAGEVISYAIAVSNDGNVTLTGVMVSDPSIADLAAVESGGFNAGDADQDGNLDVGETWQYSGTYTVTQADIDTNGGGDGTIDNIASVTTDQGATDDDDASVTVEQPGVLTLEKTGMFIDSNEDGNADPGELIEYIFVVTNDTGQALTSVVLDDPLLGGPLAGPEHDDAGGVGNNDNVLDPGEGWLYRAVYTLTGDDVGTGFVSNDATVTGFDPMTNMVSATAHLDTLLP